MKYDFIRQYLQAPFEHDAYGPDKFDCYGLHWYVCKQHGGILLPRFDDMNGQIARINAAINGQTLSTDWIEVTTPIDFDAVIMRRAGESYHVGTWFNVDGGRILHATPLGVLCNDRGALQRMRFQHFSFYRYATN